MKTAIFKRNDSRSYSLSCLMGVVSGLTLIVLEQFLRVDILDSFSVWFFACSLIALYSDDNGTAGTHTALYVLCLIDTPIMEAYIRDVIDGGFTPSMMKQWQMLLFVGIFAAMFCYALAFILNFGRKADFIGLILRFLPAGIILQDEIDCIRIVLTEHRHILTTLMQGACLIVYIMIIVMTMVFEKVSQTKKGAEYYGIYGAI